MSDFILAYGDEARQEAEKKKVDRNFITLKDGESVRGFLLSTKFPYYMQHGDYQRKIHKHTCAGKGCLSCEHGVNKVKRWAVPIYDVDKKKVGVFEASGKAVKSFYSFIDEYEEDALTTPITLTRSGSDQTTTYTVMPARVKKGEESLFVKPDDIVIDKDFYAQVLMPPDREYLQNLLASIEEEKEVKLIEDKPQEIGEDQFPF